MMDDTTLLALCIWSEAAGEPDEGKAAVAQVVMNRMARRYQSDATLVGTVLHPLAFSGFWFDFHGDSYVRVAHTLDDAKARAEAMLPHAMRQAVWPECYAIAAAALDGKPVLQNASLDNAVLYLNPKILKHLPVWASSDKLAATVGRHQFYEA
jgi:spore germination cell wall hydrolase CwlJ-like protein